MRLHALVVLALLAAACGGPTTPTSTAPTATLQTASVAARPAFLTVRLTDVRTGEAFTLGGFPGKVVLGIAMAVW